MCYFPRIMKNPKYKATKKNRGIIPPILDNRMKYVAIGCGRCIQCMKQKARNWQYRIIEDIKHNKNAKFITLTFSNESIKEIIEKFKIDAEGYALDNAIATIGVRKFLERWRKEHGKSLRHWLVTELGHKGTQNIHLHGIVWTENLEKVERIWKYGWIWKGKRVNEKLVNYVNEKTASYITKYMFKVDMEHKYYKSIVLCSKGIGEGYTINKNKNDVEKDYYKTSTGNNIGLNLYWRNKLYDENVREKQWVTMLDKNERWVGKTKFKADDFEGITKELKRLQKVNKELGFGSDEIEWERLTYENQMRELKYNERLKNNKK